MNLNEIESHSKHVYHRVPQEEKNIQVIELYL